MSYILLIIGFIILYSRISRLEEKFNHAFKKNEIVAPTQPPSPSPVLPLQSMVRPIESVSVVQPTELEPIDLVRPRTDREANQRTEFAVGGKVFTGIGILAILLAAGFFLRYAFENNLISELTRVIIGVIFGLVIIGTGHLLRRKYVSYGNVLVGGGVGILYLTIYAAHGFYGLINLPVAFLILFIITIFSSLASTFYASKPLAIWSFVGAFLIPFILPVNDSIHILFTYLLVVNSGILLIARFKVWPEITVGSLIASTLIYLQWIFHSYTDLVYLPTLLYSTALFAIYFMVSLFNFANRLGKNDNVFDAVLVYIIPVVYFLINLTIVTGRHNVALFAFLIGLFYIVVSIIVRAILAKVGELVKFSNALFLVASPFIAASVALYFERGTTITIIWALQATVMVLIGSLLNSSVNRIGGLILSLVVAFKFFALEAKLPEVAKVLFNERSVTIVCLLLMFLIFWKIYTAYVVNLSEATEDEKKIGKFIGTAGVFIVTFLWLTLEANNFINHANLYLPILWYIYVTLMMSLAFVAKEKNFRYLSYATMILALFYILVYQWVLPTALYAPFFNLRTLTALVVVCVHIYILQLWKFNPNEVEDKEVEIVKNPLILVANGIILWSLSLEILQYYNQRIKMAEGNKSLSIENTKRVVLSIFWLGYGLLGLMVGIIKRSRFARYFSIIIFGFTIFKIFLYDTANLSDIYRFASFITLGLILLIAGFAYHKYKARISELI